MVQITAQKIKAATDKSMIEIGNAEKISEKIRQDVDNARKNTEYVDAKKILSRPPGKDASQTIINRYNEAKKTAQTFETEFNDRLNKADELTRRVYKKHGLDTGEQPTSPSAGKVTTMKFDKEGNRI